MSQPHTPLPTPPPPPPAPPKRGGGGGRALRVLLVAAGAILLLVVALRAVADATTDTTTEQHRVASADVDELQVDTEGGDITLVVVLEDREEIVVSSRLTSSLWGDPSSAVTAADGTLSVSSGCDGVMLFNDCRVDHEIAIPPDALTALSVDATAGSIVVRGFGGDVEVLTTAGRVALLDFTGRTATLRSTAGPIVVDAVSPPQNLEVSTTAGEIDVTVPDEPYRVSTATTAGDINVDVRQDPGADRSITARTTAGSIDVERR